MYTGAGTCLRRYGTGSPGTGPGCGIPRCRSDAGGWWMIRYSRRHGPAGRFSDDGSGSAPPAGCHDSCVTCLRHSLRPAVAHQACRISFAPATQDNHDDNNPRKQHQVMPPSPCALCSVNRALILRPKDHSRLCKTCFITVFETEIHHTITTNSLFHRGEKVAIGASGGKDSTVLASVLKTLNERYDYGLDLILLSIDEGIKGYRDDSLETVKRNAQQYDMPLTILGYAELYGWTMDQVVEQVGKKGNCTYCGVFRRQALDRGASRLGVKHVVTGHNADDVAETVLMNCAYCLAHHVIATKY